MRGLWLLPAAALLVGCGSSSTGSAAAPVAPSSPAAVDVSPSTGAPAPRVPAAEAPAPVATPSRHAVAAVAPRLPSPTPRATRAGSPAPKPRLSPTPRPAASPAPSPRPSPQPAGQTHALEMVSGYRFSPSSLTIARGDAIRVHNGDTATHTFTGPSWDTGDMASGAVQTLRFDTAGSFSFYCSPHKSLGMTGTLTVR